jgi:hypothetical protein
MRGLSGSRYQLTFNHSHTLVEGVRARNIYRQVKYILFFFNSLIF